MQASLNTALLDQKLGKIQKQKDWSKNAISHFRNFICQSEDRSLFQINPYAVIDVLKLSERETVDLFLYGAKEGIFQMDWNLVCPCCSLTVESFKKLKQLHSHYSCPTCFRQTSTELDDYVHITFTLSAKIRSLIFHNLDQLKKKEEWIEYYYMAGSWVPVDGNMSSKEFNDQLTQHFSFFNPGEKKRIELELYPIALLILELLQMSSVIYTISEEVVSSQTEVIQFSKTGLSNQRTDCFPAKMTLHDPPQEYDFGNVYPLSSGKILLEIENLSDQRLPIWIQHVPEEVTDFPDVQFDACLTGKKLCANQTFREIFPSQVFQLGKGIRVQDQTFLFTDLKSSTALYDQIGDLNAFALVSQHFESLYEAITENQGALVKTIGDAVMAVFTNPVDATNAALAILERLKQLNQELSEQQLVIKMGIHNGGAIVVNMNDRIDFFGQTVNIAARIQDLADAEEIYITDSVYAYPGVQEIVHRCQITSEKRVLKGVQEEILLYKICPKLPH